MIRPTHALAFGAAVSAVFTVAVLARFHDMFWWPPDEGVYAYVAQRMLAGDTIHRDVIDLHAGYGNLLNALAFCLFGEDLLTLRYPLLALTALQCAIGFGLLARHGALVATAGAIGIAALSLVQFLNPSANWHALAVFFVTALVMARMPGDGARRLLLLGFLIALCFFTRQLSGVFLALGVACALLLERPDDPQGSRGPAIVIGGIMFAGLLGYLHSKDNSFAIVWAGLGPLGLITVAMRRVRMAWREALRILAWIMAGFLLGALPLVVHNALNGALAGWMRDLLVTPLQINGQDFIATMSFSHLLEYAVVLLLSDVGAVPTVSAAAWIVLIMMVPVVGGLTLLDAASGRRPGAIPILGTFWVIGAVHYQVPLYLFFVLPAAVLALLALRPRPAVAVGLIALSLWAVAFQAGRPLTRTLAGTIESVPGEPQVPSGLPRVSLRIPLSDVTDFRAIVAAIEDGARPGEPLMTIPMNPELNFITARPSPVDYYATPMALISEADLARTVEALDAAAPLFVVNRREDKYLTPLSARLLSIVRERSGPPREFGQFDLYRYVGPAPAAKSPGR